MELKISSYKELLQFIKRDDINAKQSTEIVCKALNVFALYEMTKDEVIISTEYFINTFCQTAGERPIFLNQCSIEFDIRDVYKN